MLSKIPIYQGINQYNQAINIPLPRFEDFDVRDFQENMKTVRLEMSAFRHNFYQISLLESGGGTVSSAGQAFDLGHFSLFFIQPGQINQWHVPQDWKGYYVSIAESFYTQALDKFNQLADFPFFQRFAPSFKLEKEEAKLILDIFERINAEYHSPSIYSESIIKSYLSTILSFSLRFYDRELKDEAQAQSKMGLAEQFNKLLRAYGQEVGAGLVTEQKSVSEFADELAVSAKHLSETVKKATGQSPIEHINQMLIEEAQKLLRTTNMAIKEVGYYLGFSSPSYFNRLFKKISGSSPATYRKG